MTLQQQHKQTTYRATKEYDRDMTDKEELDNLLRLLNNDKRALFEMSYLIKPQAY